MSNERPKLYLANWYQTLLTDAGLELFDQAFEVAGNLLPREDDFTVDQADLILYSPMPEDYSTGIKEQVGNAGVPYILYSNFLDRDTGWNRYEGYRYKAHDHFQWAIEHPQRVGPVLAASQHSADTIKKTYKLEDTEVGFKYMGIDGSKLAKFRLGAQNSDTLRVLWDHMWRDDKGFEFALEIIKELAIQNPDVQFVINQLNSWRGSPKTIELLQEYYEQFLRDTSTLNNIHFSQRFSNRNEYYAFLSSHNISFCTANIENFGYAMLEQSAAGIATVVPNIGCYPEQYGELFVVAMNDILNSVQQVIENPTLREEILNDRLRTVEKFDVSIQIPIFIDYIKSSI